MPPLLVTVPATAAPPVPGLQPEATEVPLVPAVAFGCRPPWVHCLTGGDAPVLDEYYSAFTYRCVDEVPVFAVQLVPSAESEKVMPVPAVQVLLTPRPMEPS